MIEDPRHERPLAALPPLAGFEGAEPRPRRATYTVPEIAALLGISRSTAYALLSSGEIPARRIGSRWIIARKRFDLWLEAAPDDVRPTGTEPRR